MDPERVGAGSSPTLLITYRGAHGHAYGPEYWKAYVRQIASLWLTPLHYTYEDLAAVTDPVLILVGDRDGACTADPELFRLLYDAGWPSPRAPITASSKRKLASSTRSPWISSCGIRAIDQPEEKTLTLPKTASREESSVLAANSRTGRFVRCLGGRRDDA